jgi:solute carrier family 30 (zinc transporter), member 9
VSAMGIFWIGCIGCTYNGIHQIFVDPSEPHFNLLTAAVLATSFVVDFSVFWSVIRGLKKEKPKGVSLFQHILNIKDPMVLAVLLEDLAATSGVIIASVGISLAIFTGMNVFDGIASLIIGLLLGGVAWALVTMNKRFLIGQSVDTEIQKGINNIILSRPSVEGLFNVQTQWYGPNQFLYKAEVDFNGIYLSHKLRNIGYENLLLNKDKKIEIANILGMYTEDVMNVIENEIRSIEFEIKQKYPEAGFIEIEPFSKNNETFEIEKYKNKEFDY